VVVTLAVAEAVVIGTLSDMTPAVLDPNVGDVILCMNSSRLARVLGEADLRWHLVDVNDASSSLLDENSAQVYASSDPSIIIEFFNQCVMSNPLPNHTLRYCDYVLVFGRFVTCSFRLETLAVLGTIRIALQYSPCAHIHLLSQFMNCCRLGNARVCVCSCDNSPMQNATRGFRPKFEKWGLA
jgi:hypothetical protein